MESQDETLAIADRMGATLVKHPLITNFDRARSASAMRARFRWIFYLDADERVPPDLGAALRQLTEKPEVDFDALLIPFRHHFAGHWMRCLYPGYTMPRMFRNGKFHFGGRLHGGAAVSGKTACFPADNPELALIHYSYDSLSHYLEKLNRYTDGEAVNMHRDGQPFHWKNAIRHWVHDFGSYYGTQNARQDGVHGFVYSFLSAFYRFEQHAKLYEKRFHGNQLGAPETAVPDSVEEVLEYALAVLREKQLPQATPINVLALDSHSSQSTAEGKAASHLMESEPASMIRANALEESTKAANSTTTRDEVGTADTNLALVWSGPLWDPSGYGEESRQFVLGLNELDEISDGTSNREAGLVSAGPVAIEVTAQALPWSYDRVEVSSQETEVLEALCAKAVKPGFIHITQNFPGGIQPHPQAAISVGRTMFETDRLPIDWVKACNRLDYVWVPTEFNAMTFAAAGVAREKLAVIPGCLEAASYRAEQDFYLAARKRRLKKRPTAGDPFTFLTVNGGVKIGHRAPRFEVFVAE
jgi:hypothetical protein